MDNKRVCALHYVMAVIGGFLGGYAVLTRSGVFASAETSNLIYLVLMIAGQDFSDFLIRLGALAIYIGGIVIVSAMSHLTTKDKRMFAILVDAAVILIQGFIPQDVDNMLATYLIFFATAVQWSSFAGIKGYVISTIFCTNNLRQFVTAALDYGFTKDPNMAVKREVYGFTLLFFHIGVLVAGFLGVIGGLKSIWFALPLTGAALILLLMEKKSAPALG